MPKVKEMDQRLGSLVDEFKELVYPPDYSPERKVPRQKRGESWVWVSLGSFETFSLWSYHRV